MRTARHAPWPQRRWAGGIATDATPAADPRARCASDETFGVACIRVYSHVWAELDRLAAPAAAPSQAERALALEILRIELLVLLDTASRNWRRSRLSASQHAAFAAVIGGVLQDLDEDDDSDLCDALERAQNRLLRAVVAYSAGEHGPTSAAAG